MSAEMKLAGGCRSSSLSIFFQDISLQQHCSFKRENETCQRLSSLRLTASDSFVVLLSPEPNQYGKPMASFKVLISSASESHKLVRGQRRKPAEGLFFLQVMLITGHPIPPPTIQ